MYEDDILSVVGDMVFTETDKSQKYNVSFGGRWSGVVSLFIRVIQHEIILIARSRRR
jgi:hypothetical protein